LRNFNLEDYNSKTKVPTALEGLNTTQITTQTKHSQSSRSLAAIKKSGLNNSLGAGSMDLLLKLPKINESKSYYWSREVARAIQSQTSRYDEDY
jgi:hypothetical protein